MHLPVPSIYFSPKKNNKRTEKNKSASRGITGEQMKRILFFLVNFLGGNFSRTSHMITHNIGVQQKDVEAVLKSSKVMQELESLCFKEPPLLLLVVVA